MSADYKIRKVNGRWELSFRNNPPIPHHSFEGALGSLWDLTRLTAHRRNPISKVAA